MALVGAQKDARMHAPSSAHIPFTAFVTPASKHPQVLLCLELPSPALFWNCRSLWSRWRRLRFPPPGACSSTIKMEEAGVILGNSLPSPWTTLFLCRVGGWPGFIIHSGLLCFVFPGSAMQIQRELQETKLYLSRCATERSHATDIITELSKHPLEAFGSRTFVGALLAPPEKNCGCSPARTYPEFLSRAVR